MVQAVAKVCCIRYDISYVASTQSSTLTQATDCHSSAVDDCGHMQAMVIRVGDCNPQELSNTVGS
jgi:hypothetical protein